MDGDDYDPNPLPDADSTHVELSVVPSNPMPMGRNPQDPEQEQHARRKRKMAFFSTASIGAVAFALAPAYSDMKPEIIRACVLWAVAGGCVLKMFLMMCDFPSWIKITIWAVLPITAGLLFWPTVVETYKAQQEFRNSADDTQLLATRFAAALDDPTRMVGFSVKLKESALLSELRPLNFGFEIMGTFDEGVAILRVAVSEVNGSRPPMYEVQWTVYSGGQEPKRSPFGFIFTNKEGPLSTINIRMDPLATPADYGPFRTLRGFMGAMFSPRLPQHLVDHASKVALSVNGWVIVEADSADASWQPASKSDSGVLRNPILLPGQSDSLLLYSPRVNVPGRIPHALWRIEFKERAPRLLLTPTPH